VKYKKVGNSIEMIEYDSFDIGQILECGQCFRFSGSDNNYSIIAHGKLLNISQTNDKIIFYPCTINEFENIWINYFDLNTDYLQIKKILSHSDNILAKAIKLCGGIRILNQDKWECLISFIISQNNRIPQIKKVIENISNMFGSKINDQYYTFPTRSQLLNATQENLQNCKAGFRSKYILDAIKSEINLENLSNLSTQDIKNTLMKIKGVGNKVADCSLLFSFGRREVYPTDVWIKRVTQEIYFNNKDVSINQIHNFAKNKFGNLAGYSQQYLFHYARNIKR
jgi:3-methyladenine DNA glycosylase/8-oxoguanine DNA glycosylase